MRKICILVSIIVALNCKSNTGLHSRQDLTVSSQPSESEDLLSNYEKAKILSLEEFKKGLKYYTPNDINIVFLNKHYIEKDSFSYNYSCFSIGFPKKGKPELDYAYEQMFLARGITESVRCNEFSDEFKDCLLSFKLTSDTMGTEKGQVIFRVKSNTLYHIIPIEFPFQATPQFGFLSTGLSKKESWRSFKKAIELYRKTPGLGDLQKLGFKKEDIDFFDKTEEWEGY